MSGEARGYGEFKRGWPVVLSSMLGIGVGLSPLPFYSIGALAPELHQAFNWGFGQIFGAVTMTTIPVILFSPLIGLLTDRFGVRRVTLTSVFLFGLSFMALGLSNGSLLLFYLNWALIATMGVGTLPITWTRAVNNLFDERKGLALGMSLLGTGLFGYLVKPFAAWMVAEHGWRAAFMAIGALPLLIALPAGLIWFHDVGPAKESAQERKAALAARRAAAPGLTAAQTFRHWRFWIIALAFLPIAFTVGGVIPNLENIFKVAGFTKGQVVGLASIVGLSVICGRVASGWLLDRMWAPSVALILLGVPAISCVMLANGPFDYNMSALAVFLIGFAAGVEYDLLAFLVARYFGMKSYSAIYGALYSFFALGAGVGPMVFGRVFDKTHTYATPLLISAGLMVAGSVLLLTLGRYPVFAKPRGADILGKAEETGDMLPI